MLPSVSTGPGTSHGVKRPPDRTRPGGGRSTTRSAASARSGTCDSRRSVGVEIVQHHERFGARVPDADWLAAVSGERMVILSRDRKMRSRPAERQAFGAAGARCFVVATGASTPLEDLRALLWAWPAILGHVDTTPAPFMYGVSRQGQLTQWLPVEGPEGPAARREALDRSRRR